MNVDTKVEAVFGNMDNRVGRWALVLAAGTNGGFPIARVYFQHGISTVIYLHIDYSDLLKMQEEQLHGNLIILGHLAGDSIGLNALADKLEERDIETVRLGIIPSK
jgi:predicted phosphodiesterase